MLPCRFGWGLVDPRVERKDVSDTDFEGLGEAQRKRETRAVFAAFQVTDRLVVNTDRIGQLLSAETAVGANPVETVENGGFVTCRATHSQQYKCYVALMQY